MSSQHEGQLFVVSAPSGAGKTSLVKALIERVGRIQVATSHTTRARRADEIDGVNYFFVAESRFQQMIADDDFLEWARVFERYYGTSREEAAHILAEGQHLLLEIDWQGAAQVRISNPKAQSIFILPPSLTTLRDRLEKRAQDDDETVRARTRAAITEISHYSDFDFLIVNDNFDVALDQLEAIVLGRGEPFTLEKQKRTLKELLNSLLSDSPHT